jgi:hypothetical protein
MQAPSPSKPAIAVLELVKVIDFSAFKRLLFWIPISVSSTPSNGPWSGEFVATKNAVPTPKLLTAVTETNISHPAVSAPTAGQALNPIPAPEAMTAAETIVNTTIESFMLFPP